MTRSTAEPAELVRAPTAVLVVLVVLAVATGCGGAPPVAPSADPGAELSVLEAQLGRRIGLYAVDTGSGAQVRHRADETVHLCSTGKALLAGAVLRAARDDPALLDRHLRWAPSALVRASPFTTARLGAGATVGELTAAAVERSDNTASNLVHDQIGGPAATTAFVRGLGDPVTRLDHLEPMPAVVSPGDDRDTTTPHWFVHDLRALVLGPALAPAARDRLAGWMRGATTGPDQIRAGVPHGWAVEDKTGQCSQGFAHDVAVIRPPQGAPIVLAVFTEPVGDHAAVGAGAAIAAATAVAVRGLGAVRSR